jgi:hypothetical protein
MLTADSHSRALATVIGWLRPWVVAALAGGLIGATILMLPPAFSEWTEAPLENPYHLAASRPAISVTPLEASAELLDASVTSTEAELATSPDDSAPATAP